VGAVVFHFLLFALKRTPCFERPAEAAGYNARSVQRLLSDSALMSKYGGWLRPLCSSVLGELMHPKPEERLSMIEAKARLRDCHQLYLDGHRTSASAVSMVAVAVSEAKLAAGTAGGDIDIDMKATTVIPLPSITEEAALETDSDGVGRCMCSLPHSVVSSCGLSICYNSRCCWKLVLVLLAYSRDCMLLCRDSDVLQPGQYRCCC